MPRRRFGQGWFYEALLPLADALVAIVAAYVAALIVGAHRGEYPYWITLSHYRVAVLFAAVLTPALFAWFGAYKPRRGESIFNELTALLFAWSLLFVILALLALLGKAGAAYSRLWVIVWFGVGVLIYLTGRLILRTTIRKFRALGVNQKRIVLVGAGELGKHAIETLNRNVWAGYQVVALFDSRMQRGETLEGIQCSGGVDELSDYLNRHDDIDMVWIALPSRAADRIQAVLAEMRHLTLDICLVPDIFSYQIINHRAVEVAGLPLIMLSSSPMTGMNLLVKELEDKCLSLAVLILAAPIMGVIALLVGLSSAGPIFFVQLRHGWDGRPIRVLKFRTMYVEQNDKAPVQATRNDPRVTPVGRLLRRSSLDELPQFWNVLKGDMSVVGPRPHAIEHNEHYKELVDRYMQRHRVKPGITGWAQVHGFRGETETVSKMEMRVEYDIYYIEHWSLWLDLRIILLTVLKVPWGKNAF